MDKELYIGIMSGTSLDGIDVALVEVSDGHIQLIDHADYPIPLAVKEQVLDICLGQQTNLKQVGTLDHQLGHLYADAVLALLEKTGHSKEQITAIGNHGQTVFHQPTGDAPFTTQIGDANIIATRTGITTIADFRRKDMALGGQGAPLVPAFHQSLFQSNTSSIVVLNIGGIANISVLRPDHPVIGYDTGPGNMLMDAWCHQHQGQPYDKDALFAQQGHVDTTLLNTLLQEPYLAQKAPKSTGRELFNLPWLEAILSNHNCSAEDVQRTLCEYTARTISSEVEKFSLGETPQLLICGGGACNPLLMNRLKALLPAWSVDSTDSQGVDSQNMEAMAFAWLAYRRIHNLPSNLPEVTGASHPASLGVMYFAD
ncbi:MULTISPECIES: anhydro-N-acetylmuramic acid kinase [unclassified Vibrio]|uniref:anhydro-N-acetylmuramic acid kinase n=1 Tax=unclassified Vibrio TaxID=2614977 RepID=UPI001268ACE8|nr:MULTISPECIES: anhydro-N-acetylmuramic acid kinase [unclassified Vibrio]MCM5510284.1 anhydro-N-acetylmuramic acid kinase [Vibrio sp. SCSIO 43169]QFT35363.1 Anhydro-N-acetylmuramic acid kinase [Vibrio sp. THAF64]QGM33262.1 Anhydro-N-acetylmuramic acid kinase [Vibrio sp. THAF191d]QGN68764.1 Anhydro-N-acetylmuramic acid kinase [Vibrio sp. THAF191c]